MTNLPIENVINVTIQSAPQGLGESNVNNVALFTTETPSNTDVYRTYLSASAVTADYGTSAITTAMANNVFAQAPNLLTGRGQLIIIPLQSSVSATVGDVTTADISANVAGIIAVTDGDLRVVINGENTDLTNLNFTAATDIAGIVAILQRNLPNLIVTVEGTNTIKFESKKVGADSDVTLAAVPGGSGTDLSGASFFNATGSTPTSGADATGETIAEAIARTEGTVFYSGVMTNLLTEDDAIEAAAAVVQSRDMIFVQQGSSAEDIGGIGATIRAASQEKTRVLVYTTGVAEANLMKAAYVGRAFSTNFSGAATAQTMNLKELDNVTPDQGINQTLLTQAQTEGTDLYVSYGVPSVVSTGGNDFFDNVYNQTQLKFSLETAGFNYLRQTNTKIPQTELGIEGLKNAYAQVLQRFVTNGVIAPGEWTVPDTFGDPDIFRQNIRETGFYIFSIPVAQQPAPDRENREAPLIQIAVKLAGAVHSSDVIVNINR